MKVVLRIDNNHKILFFVNFTYLTFETLCGFYNSKDFIPLTAYLDFFFLY